MAERVRRELKADAAMAEVTQQRTRGRRPTRVGIVASDVRDKTIKVVVENLVKHPRYGKYIRRRTVLHAHDEHNEARVGDEVEVMECRPYSRTKKWRLVRVVKRAEER